MLLNTSHHDRVARRVSFSTRRALITWTLFCLLLGWRGLEAQTPDAVVADVLLTGAEIHLGNGESIPNGDLAIRDDRIVAVGAFDVESAKQTIDCRGNVICPGFIDLHNHSDEGIIERTRRSAMNYLMQGCTTIVTGNCGSGPIDVGNYYRTIDEQGAGPNIIHLLPQGNLRGQVIGSNREEADDSDIHAMCRLAEKAMRDGAWGMSSGLIYVPSSYASTDELVAIARVVGQYGGIYASHIRNEGKELLDAVDEALEIGRRAKLPVHISHFKSSGKDSWGLVRTAAATIDARRAEGQVITADQYPYTASSTSLQAILLPSWARAGGRAEMLKRLHPDHPDSATAIAAVREKLQVTDNGHRIQIASFSKRADWSGKRLDEIAAAEKCSTLDLFLQIERGGGASVVNHSIDELDVRFVMQLPWVATASDGSAKVPGYKVPHPRSYGTFPRKLGHYSIREKTISLSHAIRSCTGLPAQILGLRDRGLIAAGQFADIVVFDKNELIDTATFDDPHQYNRGIFHVYINGKPVVYRGQPTGILAGRALRKPSVASSSPEAK